MKYMLLNQGNIFQLSIICYLGNNPESHNYYLVVNLTKRVQEKGKMTNM